MERNQTMDTETIAEQLARLRAHRGTLEEWRSITDAEIARVQAEAQALLSGAGTGEAGR